MLSESEKQEVYDIDRQIQELQNKKLKINPYSCLKNLYGKAFGEGWSELHILKQCPKLERDNSKGHDFYNKNLGKIELKSFRIPSTSSTANQCYPKELRGSELKKYCLPLSRVLKDQTPLELTEKDLDNGFDYLIYSGKLFEM